MVRRDKGYIGQRMMRLEVPGREEEEGQRGNVWMLLGRICLQSV